MGLKKVGKLEYQYDESLDISYNNLRFNRYMLSIATQLKIADNELFLVIPKQIHLDLKDLVDLEKAKLGGIDGQVEFFGYSIEDGFKRRIIKVNITIDNKRIAYEYDRLKAQFSHTSEGELLSNFAKDYTKWKRDYFGKNDRILKLYTDKIDISDANIVEINTSLVRSPNRLYFVNTDVTKGLMNNKFVRRIENLLNANQIKPSYLTKYENRLSANIQKDKMLYKDYQYRLQNSTIYKDIIKDNFLHQNGVYTHRKIQMDIMFSFDYLIVKYKNIDMTDDIIDFKAMRIREYTEYVIKIFAHRGLIRDTNMLEHYRKSLESVFDFRKKII